MDAPVDAAWLEALYGCPFSREVLRVVARPPPRPGRSYQYQAESLRPALTLRQHLGDRPLGRRVRRPLHKKGRIVQADHPLVVRWPMYNPYWVVSPAATRSGRQRGTVKYFDRPHSVDSTIDAYMPPLYLATRRAEYVSLSGRVAPDGGIPDKDDVYAHQNDVVGRVDCGLFSCGYPKSLAQGERVEYDWAPSPIPASLYKTPGIRDGEAVRIRRIAWRRILAQNHHLQPTRLHLPEGGRLWQREAEEVFSFLGCGGSYEHDATRTRQQQAWALVEKVCATVEATRVFDVTDSAEYLAANLRWKIASFRSYKFLVQCRSDLEVGRDVGEAGQAACREAVDMLRRVLATRAKLLGDAHVATGEAKYALGLLHLFNGTDLNEARELVKDAAQTYSKHLGPDHEKTKHVVDVLQRIPAETPMESAPDTAAAVFDETDSFKLAVGQETGGDVVEELRAELTVLLTKRDLETVEVVVDEVSQETVDERRRELEALLRETRDPELKQLPLRAPRGDAAADCWAARFAAKNVTILLHPLDRIHHLEQRASKLLSDFNREHADLEAVLEKERAVAAWRVREQDAAARIEDHVAVAEHLATRLRRKITSLRRDRPAIDAWLEPTEQFVASTFQHLRAPDDNVMPAGGPTADEDATIIAQLILHRGLCGGRRAGYSQCELGGRTLVFWERVRDGLVAAHPRWRGPSGEMVSVGWLQEYARRGGRDSLVERALMLPDVAAREEREQPWARPPANIRRYVAPVSTGMATLFLVRRVLEKEDYRAYLGYLAAQEGVKELAVHAVPRPNDILAYFLVGVTKNMRLKGFSKLADTTCAACTMLSRKASVRGVSVMVWKQLTTRCKYVKYKEHTRTRRKRPRPEPAPARRSADGP